MIENIFEELTVQQYIIYLKKKRVLSEYLICKMRNSDTFGFSFFWISKAVSLMTLSILIFNYCQQRKNNDEKFHQAK